MSLHSVKRYLTLVFALWSVCGGLLAQDIQVKGRFQADSLRIGDEVFFSLSARYPVDKQILFPDTSFNYGAFELIKKRFFITETSGGTSFDSAVYHVRTFEVDSVLRFRLPVYEVNALDCTRIYSNWDTVRVQLLIRALPENLMADLPVRATIAYQNVKREINTPLLVVATALTLALAGVVWVVFGESIRKRYRIRKLRHMHMKFNSSFNHEVEKLKGEFSRQRTEQTLLLWKKYMEHLNLKPYTKLTTRETLVIENDTSLASGLRKLDAAIYGSGNKVVEPLLVLRDFAENRFNEKIKEVRDGS